MEKESNKTKLSRRDFIKVSTAAGAGTVIAGCSSGENPVKAGTAYAASFYTKELDEFPIEINEDFERFNNSNVAFMRGFRAETLEIGQALQTFGGKEGGHIPPTGRPGYTEIDSALVVGAYSVTDGFAEFSKFGVPSAGLYSWEPSKYSELNTEDRRTNFASPEEASKYVKRAAKFYGASLVGICKYDEKWTYTHYFDPNDGQEKKVEFPIEPKYTIVMAHEMDYDAFRCAPSLIESAAVANMYSNMAVRTHQLATFIRRLGYNAFPCGNDTSISIANAVDAGLGQLSRMGMLVTEKYGPRVRLSKIHTDLELMPDKRVDFGVEEFCKVCMKCADNCPSGAISKDVEPSYEIKDHSNMSGVKKWTIDAVKCFTFWSENGGDCGSCLAVCPYNKLDEWHHDLAKLATVTPGVRTVARQLDELFGYGKVNNEEAYDEFWELKED